VWILGVFCFPSLPRGEKFAIMDENFAMNTQSIDSQPEAGSRVRWPIRNQIMLPMVSLMVARLVAVSVLNAFLSVRRTHRRIARELKRPGTSSLSRR
jgi:hypothetical protein